MHQSFHQQRNSSSDDCTFPLLAYSLKVLACLALLKPTVPFGSLDWCMQPGWACSTCSPSVLVRKDCICLTGVTCLNACLVFFGSFSFPLVIILKKCYLFPARFFHVTKTSRLVSLGFQTSLSSFSKGDKDLSCRGGRRIREGGFAGGRGCVFDCSWLFGWTPWLC